MTSEEQQARTELHAWQQQMQQAPSLLNRFARRVQIRLNALLPERVQADCGSACWSVVLNGRLPDRGEFVESHRSLQICL